MSYELLDKIEELQEHLEYLNERLEASKTDEDIEHFETEIRFIQGKIRDTREQLKLYEDEDFDKWYSNQDMRMSEAGMSYKDFL